MKDLIIDNRTNIDTKNVTYRLHDHDTYEIYLFFEGDAEYIIEGRTYSLNPYDMIIIRRHEMHRAIHKSNAPYSRMVINIHPDFFVSEHCELYEHYFKDTDEKVGNKIRADVVKSSGLLGIYTRLSEYTENWTDFDTPVVRSVIVEMLYLINRISKFAIDDSLDAPVKRIIAYVNANYMNNIDLDFISDKFFISKYYLCHMFKKATGMTIHRYITHKRIMIVRDMISEGKSITEAAISCGFNNYSSFYRAYKREFGETPRNIRL